MQETNQINITNFKDIFVDFWDFIGGAMSLLRDETNPDNINVRLLCSTDNAPPTEIAFTMTQGQYDILHTSEIDMDTHISVVKAKLADMGLIEN